MATLVLNRNSIGVKLESEHLVISDHADGGTARRVPLVSVERVVVVGQPAITFPALAKFMDMGIPCSFLSHGGRWRGIMDGDPGFHALRRIRQYEKIGDFDFTLRMARQLVAAKIANSRRTIQRLAAERRIALDSDECWRALSSCGGALACAKSPDDVRGVEGFAARAYFRLLSRFFPDDAPFASRTRRPPRDEANALLSFAYTLLTNVFCASIRAHGLDAAAGFFHRASDRAPALALDLMEPHRSPWADRLVLNLLNHRRIRRDEHFARSESDGVFLNDQGRKVFFTAFDEMMERRQTTEAGELSLRAIADRSVCRFIEAIESAGDVEFYRSA